MRLTLRTLLAWLDDTLPAGEVRQIGKQVAESTYAQELVDRTYRVTRQRRLLVPSNNGPDATDPNVVAAYLDNELPAEEVAEYEKKCLTSDVNLAEVASVHQILSLIGQKAKVPPDAKARMYRLVRGRESVNALEAVRRPSPPVAPDPITPPPTPWSSPVTPSRPLPERFGLAALVLGLIGLIVWTGYSTFAPETDRPLARVAQADNPAVPPPNPPAEPPKEAVPTPATVEAAKPAPPLQATADATKDAKAAPAKLMNVETVLLAWSPEKTDWSRVAASAPIKEDTRLLNLAPFTSNLQVDNVRLTLIDETEVAYQGHDAKVALKLGFNRGRSILAGGPDGAPYLLTFAGKTLSIVNAPGALVGLQRSWTHTPGVATAESAPVTIFVNDGEVVLQSGDVKKTLMGPAIATWNEAGVLQTSSRSAMPPWLTEASPAPSVKDLSERFLKNFSPNGPVLRDLVQAVDADDADVRRLAIQALGAVGDAEMVVPVLNAAMADPATRRAAADVLRSMIARGGDSAKAVHEELVKVFGAEWAEPTEKLLVGFTPEEGRRESTYADLVRALSTPELGTRDLALQALTSLTGRDNLEFDPTKPEGKGLKAWQDLVHRKEIMKGNTR